MQTTAHTIYPLASVMKFKYYVMSVQKCAFAYEFISVSFSVVSEPFKWRHLTRAIPVNHHRTRMWANAQRDGRPAEYRWRPLFNAAKFG